MQLQNELCKNFKIKENGGFANSKVSVIRANVSVKFPDVTDTIARIKDTGSGTILQGALYVKIKDPF